MSNHLHAFGKPVAGWLVLSIDPGVIGAATNGRAPHPLASGPLNRALGRRLAPSGHDCQGGVAGSMDSKRSISDFS